MPGRKPGCEGPHRRIGRQVPDQLASRLESLWPLIAGETTKRRALKRQVRSPQLGTATQLRRPELRRSPGSSRTARPTICPARVRQSSLRSAYYLLTSPNCLLEILCRSGILRLVVSLNGVQEVASSNLAGPTNFPPVTHHFPIVPTTLEQAGLRQCRPVLASGACHVLTAGCLPSSRSPRCVGSYKSNSNGRANGDGRRFPTRLECLARVRGGCTRELREWIQAVESRGPGATTDGQRRRDRSIHPTAQTRIPHWSHAFSQPPPMRRAQLPWWASWLRSGVGERARAPSVAWSGPLTAGDAPR